MNTMMKKKQLYTAPFTDVMMPDMQLMKDYDYSRIPDPHQDPVPQRLGQLYI